MCQYNVVRIAQWDWQGRLKDDPIMCSANAEQGKPANGGKCKFVARYHFDGDPLCVRHAQVRALNSLASDSYA